MLMGPRVLVFPLPVIPAGEDPSPAVECVRPPPRSSALGIFGASPTGSSVFAVGLIDCSPVAIVVGIHGGAQG
jgi:hypothetical protein